MIENELSNKIIGCAIEVHKQLGPGLLESAYQECLYYELVQAGLLVSSEVPMPIIYKEVKLDHGYRMDLLVENRVVIEIKTVGSIHRCPYSAGFNLSQIGQLQAWSLDQLSCIDAQKWDKNNNQLRLTNHHRAVLQRFLENTLCALMPSL